MRLARLACATLSLALAARADSLATLAGFSHWRFVLLERAGPDGFFGVRWRGTAKDFQDTRFQYRWKSERSNIDSHVCSVEIRPTDDIGESDKLPEIHVDYYDPTSLAHYHWFTAHDITVSKATHAYLKPTGCQTINAVSWRK